MIISRTPLRMSFVGGGSDLPSFYERYGGAVLSTAIDKYVFVTCNPKFDSGIRLAYSRTEEVPSVEKIEHRLVRETMKLLQLEGGVEITTIADVPSKGTGLGSSSSFTVGLLNVLHAFQGRYASPTTLGAQSCQVEIDLCKEPIGKQDQYAAAFGGLNLIEFQPTGRVDVTPVVMPVARRELLSNRIIAFYTGITRSASELLQVQSANVSNDGDKQKTLQRMVQLTYDLKRELESGNLDSFGEILHENWELKRSLASGISNGDIDEWYDTAMRNGASGGKLLGAGTGGFMIFYADEEKHDAIVKSLGHLRRTKFNFEPLGSRIIFYNI
ncbi:MAG: GHMP kinase [Methylocystis sp.]|nr:GHMP kinase [Methylocystis sp.]MCA3583987.1 GHMP kinase [Methylocystis sp.]MCA3588910.1 GHMP kinase [Methylocystis sp.]MCA3592518.1 GHMP kinase [Methylocystis sp.]